LQIPIIVQPAPSQRFYTKLRTSHLASLTTLSNPGLALIGQHHQHQGISASRATSLQFLVPGG